MYSNLKRLAVVAAVGAIGILAPVTSASAASMPPRASLDLGFVPDFIGPSVWPGAFGVVGPTVYTVGAGNVFVGTHDHHHRGRGHRRGGAGRLTAVRDGSSRGLARRLPADVSWRGGGTVGEPGTVRPRAAPGAGASVGYRSSARARGARAWGRAPDPRRGAESRRGSPHAPRGRPSAVIASSQPGQSPSMASGVAWRAASLTASSSRAPRGTIGLSAPLPPGRRTSIPNARGTRKAPLSASNLPDGAQPRSEKISPLSDIPDIRLRGSAEALRIVTAVDGDLARRRGRGVSSRCSGRRDRARRRRCG